MSDQDLAAKQAYFEDQALLDLFDDEQDLKDESSKVIDAAMIDSKARALPGLVRQTSSFLGPTPKQKLAEFTVYTQKQRASRRLGGHTLITSSTAPELESANSFAVSKPSSGPANEIGSDNNKKTLDRPESLPNLAGRKLLPFYKQVGTVPRELKTGRNVKPADNIKVEPEQRQLLCGKIIYFYPNDDISMVRRTRIHKVIQLGAAWVNRWRDDVTHIMVDDASHTYSQLLRHLNRAGFPRGVILVKFDPYVPQCIQFGTLLDPNAQRFSVKGAPQTTQIMQATKPFQDSSLSQSSLHIKPSRRHIDAQEAQKNESNPREDNVAETLLAVAPDLMAVASSPCEDIVKDSFNIHSSSEQSHSAKAKHMEPFDDALTQAIEEAKALAHLPLDTEDDTPFPTVSVVDYTDGPGLEEEHPETVSKPGRRSNLVSKASAPRDKHAIDLNMFQCMDPGANGYTSQNPNARTIQILEDMCKHYDQMQDHWRTLAYRKGVASLKKQKVKISTAKQAAALPFVGPRLAEKIEEIVLTDRLRKLDHARDDPLDAVLRLFLGVYGVGLVQANKWIQDGQRTLEDLLQNVTLATAHKVGIEHYNDFNSRIPRAEVEAHGAIVKKVLHRIDAKFEATVMGSYRRGAKDSGDIDMIITCPGTSLAAIHTTVFDELIPQLYKAGFIKASLATSGRNDSTGTKWHGASCLPASKIWRRLDFLLVPEEEMGAALIYFTGNDIFNRSIRLLARKKGMVLNQRGLFKNVERGRRGEKLNQGVLVEGRNERKIFELLGVPWREPHERVC